MSTPRLNRRPEARSLAVERIIEQIKDGKVRVPHFQRPLRWRTSHVTELFDSVYRGLPVGVLLLSKEAVGDETVHFGSLAIEGTSISDGLVVIDGQQRITALGAALLHPDKEPRGDIFAIWFDLETERFQRLESNEIPPAWIPLNVVVDSFDLLRWLDNWPYRSERPDLVKRAIALGKALREYQMPAYIVEGADEPVLRTIFKRINTSGVEMRESEVFQALFGTRQDSVRGACERLVNTGFGMLNPDWFLRCLRAVDNIDPRIPIDERKMEIEEGSVNRTEAAVRAATAFLMDEVGIFHHQFLPYRLTLVVLSRFFHLHPLPTPRTRLHLRWWVWRGALSHVHTDSSNANVRRLLADIDKDESQSALRLLERTSDEWPEPDPLATWYGQSANTRLCALAMLALSPVSLESNEPWSVRAVQERLGDERSLGDLFLDVGSRPASAVSGRVVATKTRFVKMLPAKPANVLQTHAVDDVAVQALLSGDYEAFSKHRADCLRVPFQGFFRERAGYQEVVRPEIRVILREVERFRGSRS